jgi:DNA transposition AAA+ family ATPase
MQKEFKEFMQKHGLTQAMIARSLGVSSSQISQWLKGKYKGDVEALEMKLGNFINNYNKRGFKESEEIYETTDLRMAHFTIDEAIIGKEMCLLYGESGVGKTTAIKEYVKNRPEAVLIEVIPGMSVKSFLRRIAKAVGVNEVLNTEELLLEIVKEFKRREAVLIIDEAENLTTNALESIRRIWDFSQVPIALVGTYAVIPNLKGRRGELKQLFGRIIGRWEFKGPQSDEEWKMFFGEWAKEVKKYTKHLRRAVNMYKKAKRLAELENKELNAGYIQMASSMVILD